MANRPWSISFFSAANIDTAGEERENCYEKKEDGKIFFMSVLFIFLLISRRISGNGCEIRREGGKNERAHNSIGGDMNDNT